MNFRSIVCVTVLFVGMAHSAMGQTIVKAADYGVKANSFENAAPAIRNAIAACKEKNNAVLKLPGGRIDIWPVGAEKKELYVSNATESDTLSKVKNIAFLFEDCKDITLDGNHSLIVLHGKMVSFALLGSHNIKIKNISFDYERPTMSELTVKSVSDTAIEAVIHPDSRYAIDSGRIGFYGEGWKSLHHHAILFNPVNETMHYSSLEPFLKAKAVETSPLHVRFEGRIDKNRFRAGEVLTVRDPYRDNCGAFISLSKNIELDNVRMYYMHGLGIVSQFSENISLFKVRIAPRENSGRIVASFADCFHFSGCRGLIKVDSCFTSGSHDDPLNVHGTHLQVVTVDEARKIKLRFMHHQTYGFAAFFAGDSVAFVNPKTLLPLGYAKLRAAKLLNRREMEVEVEGDSPAFAQAGICVENLTWTPEVIIRNSHFERTNTRGLLITTRRKVLVEKNVFYRTGMFPILIADDAASWFESGAVQDVTIRNNVFDNCGYNSGSGAINIAPENHELVTGKTVHRNIHIVDNVFKTFSGAVLSARSVEGLQFSGNTIIVSGIFGKQNPGAAISLFACKKVMIEKNHFETAVIPFINASGMKKTDVRTTWKLNLQP